MTIYETLENIQEHYKMRTTNDDYSRVLVEDHRWRSVSDRVVQGKRKDNAFLQAIETVRLDQPDNPTLDELVPSVVREQPGEGAPSGPF